MKRSRKGGFTIVEVLIAIIMLSIGVLALIYTVIHFIDAMVIAPWVMGKSVDLHPMVIIVGLAIGGTLGGLLGMLLAIPLLAVAKAVIGTIVDAARLGELV